MRCICRTLVEIYGPTGLALRGAYERGDEFVTDSDCPVHGSSAKAKAIRQAWLDDVADEMAAYTEVPQ